jgi:UDP-GlcNAc:undecaprenyl-phosphate GlcNAc-1-phosphate transferase
MLSSVALAYLALMLVAFLLSWVFTRELRNWAIARGWAAPPASARHIHATSTPRLGGVAVYLAFVSVLALGFLTEPFLDFTFAVSSTTALQLLLPGTLVLLVGLYDDIFGLKYYFKFAGQIVAGAMLFVIGFRIFELPLLFGLRLGWLAGLVLTIFWVVLITNAFNLLDGLDGLAAGSALFSTLIVFVLCMLTGNDLVATMTVALAGAILGFLRYNFTPASIFLGDSGSLFIGYMLSALALAGAQKSTTMIAVAIPVVSFGLPILDTSVAVVRRFLGGKPLFVADRQHIHHKLLERGLSHREAVILLYGVSAAFALLSMMVMNFGGRAFAVILLVVGMGVWFMVQQLHYHEFVELKRIARRAIDQRQVIVKDLAVRRATERFADVHDLSAIRSVLREAFESNEFDGFELTVSSPATGDAPACYWWQRTPGNPDPADLRASAWVLALELVNGDNQSYGSLRLYRVYDGRPLLLDINVLTTDFRAALADALGRACRLHEPASAADSRAASAD